MLCRRPFVKAGVPFPCGQCDPCRFNRRRLWQHRLMLERVCHRDAVFATLTYDDDNLPIHGSVDRRVGQLFMKRLRKRYDFPIRFYLVGEYGDTSRRPHYHVMVFGVPACRRGSTLLVLGSTRSDWVNCCSQCRIFGECWGFGDILLGSVTMESAGYIAGYTVKKMTHASDTRLYWDGRSHSPEFATMSLRPGIGADAMWNVASIMLADWFPDRDDVPMSLDYGRLSRPLGRYLRDKLRVMIGKKEGASDEALAKYKEELFSVYSIWFENSKELGCSFGEFVSSLDDGKYALFKARNDIYKGRKSI